MNEAVTIALIGLAGSGLGSVLGVIASAKLINYRLEQLEKRVQAHNSLVERTFKLEERTGLQEEKLRAASRRLDALEHSA